jgi:two-component system, LytTR family, response regulator
MRVLIVDDETLARAFLSEQLAGIPGIEIVGQAANGYEAVKLVEELSPELMFLDIQMPKLSGFEVLDLLGDRAPAVIFATAYDEFALRAFDVHAVDYILKPVDPDRLKAALTRATERLQGRQPSPPMKEVAAAAQPPDKKLERILIREEARVHVLPIDTIDYIEAQDDYLSFAVGGKLHRKQQTMAELESQLDPARFVRIHRSFILNIDRLARLELYTKDSWLAILTSGKQLPVSRTGHARLKELIK